MFPEEPWETLLVREIIQLPANLVVRPPRAQLDWARMKQNECHANASWYADNDPEGLSRMVSGWWIQWPNLVFHSVVEREGQLICVTPTPFDEGEFGFIPDDAVVWSDDGRTKTAHRDGHEIGFGLRAFPSVTIAQCELVESRLRAGIHPYRAIEMSDDEVEHFKRLAEERYPGLYNGLL